MKNYFLFGFNAHILQLYQTRHDPGVLSFFKQNQKIIFTNLNSL